MRRCRSAAARLEQAEADVAFDREPGEHAALLKHEDAPRIGAVHRLAVDEDLAARRREEAGHDVQQRGFAAARGAEQADELAFAHFEADVVQHVDAAAVALERPC